MNSSTVVLAVRTSEGAYLVSLGLPRPCSVAFRRMIDEALAKSMKTFAPLHRWVLLDVSWGYLGRNFFLFDFFYVDYTDDNEFSEGKGGIEATLGSMSMAQAYYRLCQDTEILVDIFVPERNFDFCEPELLRTIEENAIAQPSGESGNSMVRLLDYQFFDNVPVVPAEHHGWIAPLVESEFRVLVKKRTSFRRLKKKERSFNSVEYEI